MGRGGGGEEREKKYFFKKKGGERGEWGKIKRERLQRLVKEWGKQSM